MNEQRTTNNQIELMAPAGSLESAQAAIEAGADVIYAGPGSVSMRPRRAEFREEQLQELINYAHGRGKKVYVVANIYPKSYDVGFFKKALARIYQMGADAIVVSDLWALRYVKKNFDIEAHVSIQASVSSDITARFFEENGADVIVISRSLPKIKDIKEIRQAINCRLEVFIHGGICFMFDGNCYMSSFYKQKWAFDKERQIRRLYGQNNTKGECHLVCKRNFQLKNNGSKADEGRLMRRPDLVGLETLPLYIESGVNIFKIEGRAMDKRYVKQAVSLYRQAIDNYLQKPSQYKPKEEWLDEAEELKQYRLEYERKWNIK